MNRITNKILGYSSKRIIGNEQRKVKTSGKLFDWCQEKLKPMGLYVEDVTPYSLAVWRDENVIGYYNTLTEIKKAIIGGYVHENYNL